MKTAFTRRKFIRYGISLLAGITFIDAIWLEKLFIETNEFHLGDATRNTPPIRIAQISDLHLHTIGSVHTKIANRVNSYKPDLIFFTGDSVDKAEYIDLLRDFMKLLDAKVQKVAILGNWEYWGNIDLRKLRMIYSDYNCDLLINQSKQYSVRNKRISITGIDDFIGSHADYVAARDTYRDSDYHIVLTHCPEHRDVIVQQQGKERIDLILSGHTHGGQLNILGFTPFKPPGSGKYLKGWYKESSPPLYVSKGIGTSILPVRLGARSEISMFNIAV
ncbi:MAG TPA: metallophosphoesterase [Ohtaekwangia sp.]|uniref:metallophosphoesterase n=1 Tax=Ohtaekwangia sp. TaxID=2066019 RepID=UPI002F953DFB